MKLLYGVIEIKGISFLMFSVFAVSIAGYLLGRIRIKGVGLGTAGVFIIALIYGALFSNHISSTVVQGSGQNKVDISSNALKIVENIGLIFFIGAVGFISGPGFFKNLKKNFKSFIILGVVIILSSSITCVICFYIGKSSEKDEKEFVAMLVGIFSGALTSTPAFSAAKATTDTKYESAVTVGHGIAYLYGVIGVVLFVQLVPKVVRADMDRERRLLTGEDIKMSINKTEGQQDTNGSKVEYEHGIATTEQGDSSSRPQNIKNKNEKNIDNEKAHKDNILTISTEMKEKKNDKENKEEDKEDELKTKHEETNQKEEQKEEIKDEPSFIIDPFGFCVFSLGAFIGIFIGAIKIPLSSDGLDGTTFSLTTTGGILISSLVISHFGRICKLSLKVEKRILEVFRELGLFLFLVGTGISGGAKFVEYFKAIYFVYGIFMTTIPLFVGFIFGKYVLKLCLLNNLGSITGGMTSTPALGTLINVCHCDEVGGSYAATYPISLIAVVLASQFMVLLLK